MRSITQIGSLRRRVGRTLLFLLAVGLEDSVRAQMQEFPAPATLQFPSGYHVVKEPHARTEIVKTVPGPTEATVKAAYRDEGGLLFYLSDWSWDRRAEGKSFYWMVPLAPPIPAAPANPAPAGGSGIQILSQAQELSFPSGFMIVEAPSANARQIALKEGPLTANVRAYIDQDGIRFFMSDWSFDRAQQGHPANWMRPLGDAAPPPASPGPQLPDGYEFSERDHETVFERGYVEVDRIDVNAPPRRIVGEPVILRTAGEAVSRDGIYHLTNEQNERRKAGQSYTWVRANDPPARPDLLPVMRELAAGHDLRFPPENCVDSPWMISSELYEIDPERSIAAMRQVPIEPYLTILSSYHEDAEFPYPWLKEVARHLKEKGALDQALATLRAHFPYHDPILQLWIQVGEGEMMRGYMQGRKQFDQRLMAIMEAERGNFAEVEALLSPWLAGWTPESDGLNASGPRINMLRELARAQWKQGKTEDAKVSTRIWLGAYTRNIANDLLHPDYVDAGQRVMEFDSDFEAVGEYFDLLEAVTDPQVAAEIVIGLKGLRLAVASSQQVRYPASSDPEVAALSSELIRLSEEEEKDAIGGKAGDYDRESRIQELHAKLAMRRLSGVRLDLASDPEWSRLNGEIERRLVAGEDEWDVKELADRRDLIALDHLVSEGEFIASPEMIAARLRPTEVLLDFFELPPVSIGSTGIYGVVVISGNGPPRLVRLGRSDTIDAAVRRFRGLMESTGPFDDAVFASMDRQTDEALAECHRLMVEPLLPHIGGARDLVVCLDGQLLFLPFDGIRLVGGELVGEMWEVTYVNAARDLLRDAASGEIAEPTALLVGSPEFRASATRESTAKVPGALVLDSRAVASLADALRGFEFAPLPGTAEEISSLEPKLKAAGFHVESLLGDEATETKLTGMEKSPTLLHFATHGFFLEELPVLRAGVGGEEEDSAMLLSGLALSGAQNTLDAWKEGRIPSPGSDGIFLATEVSRLDLTGTRTVVLSACETAVGKALNGEGVEGLRSGLILAGAESVVLTLWPVDDAATVEVMEVFYTKLLAGTPAPTAMAETKRELFAKFRQEDGNYLAHRFVDPFIVTRSGALAR